MTKDITKDTAQLLKKYIDGIEMYEDQKKEIAMSIKEIFDEAKSAGFDTGIMRKIISLRKLDKTKLEEQEYLLDAYKDALGMK